MMKTNDYPPRPFHYTILPNKIGETFQFTYCHFPNVNILNGFKHSNLAMALQI